MPFKDFSKAVDQQFRFMAPHGLFQVLLGKDQIWEAYLAAFPPGSNPIFRQRTEHDCQCCKHFIRAVGGVVSIINGQVVTIWDINIGGPFQVVADVLSALVKMSAIDNIFLHTERTVGSAKTFEPTLTGNVTWNHFQLDLPNECVVRGIDIGPKLSEARSTKDVMLRGLTEITVDAIDTVLELMSQGSLPRGDEKKFAVQEFQKLKTAFDNLPGSPARRDRAAELFCWSRLKTVTHAVLRIRNDVVGTLLTDLSEGKELTVALKAWDVKMAPTNYKRPTAPVTKAMVQSAQAKIAEMGFTSALERRYATAEDITINNILFANRTTKKVMNGDVFDDLISAVPEKAKSFDKVEEVTIENFLTNVLPKAQSVELLVENRHTSNLVSLIAPVHADAKNMFKWSNRFSWSYAGELTDSIKERVKNAGGRVDGDLRCSLSWYNYDDLDLHMIEPGGHEIYFRDTLSATTLGNLDVDMNAGSAKSKTPVENICYPNRDRMREGTYTLKVHNYCQRETIDVGFEVEVEFNGEIHTFAYTKAVRDDTTVIVAKFKYTHKSGIEFLESLPSTQASKSAWGITTQTFQKVNVVMLSPNHWDGLPVGNKHYFFMLDGCLNDGKARGFFNEFLLDDLNAHRKVFEMVGSKMKTEESDRQLSGVGFSSTQRNNIMCRVKGSFSRTIKITF